jgi:hypothetical protein
LQRSVPMRWTCWGFALLAASGLVRLALGVETVHGAAGLSSSHSPGEACSQTACVAAAGSPLSPGCRGCQTSRCDNVWAGYCQQKAKWQAFWSRVGTPRPICPPMKHGVLRPVSGSHDPGLPAQAPMPATLTEPPGRDPEPSSSAAHDPAAAASESVAATARRPTKEERIWKWPPVGFR